MLSVSLSAVQSYRRCQQLYSYRYVERLKRNDKAPAPELGIILHDYLETYYKGLQVGKLSPQDCHQFALAKVTKKYIKEIRSFARMAANAGEQELAEELLDIPKAVNRIAERYFWARGQFDAEQYEILAVELSTNSQLTRTIESNGRIDMLTRDKDKGIVRLWDHKSTKNVPDDAYRMRDLQTLLYASQIDTEVDAVMWNYLRTKEPTVPAPLVRGGLSKAKNIDTTWEVYAAAATKAGLYLADYDDMREGLEGRELSVFFPRYEQVLIVKPNILLRDYTRSAIEIKAKRASWESDKAFPVRNIQLDCSWCEYKDLCNAVIFSGDDSAIRKMRFTNF